MLSYKKYIVGLFTLFFVYNVFFINESYSVDGSSKKGYKIIDSAKAYARKCNSTDDSSVGDQNQCDSKSTAQGSTCDVIPSTRGEDTPVYMCNPSGEMFCFKDSDCQVLGKETCVVKPGSSQKFETQLDEDEILTELTVIGICSSYGGTGEKNAFGQAICNLMNVVTGNAGRAVVGVVVIVVGIMFYLGKVTWSLVLAVALGAGAMFGAKSVVKIVTGKEFTC